MHSGRETEEGTVKECPPPLKLTYPLMLADIPPHVNTPMQKSQNTDVDFLWQRDGGGHGGGVGGVSEKNSVEPERHPYRTMVRSASICIVYMYGIYIYTMYTFIETIKLLPSDEGTTERGLRIIS